MKKQVRFEVIEFLLISAGYIIENNIHLTIGGIITSFGIFMVDDDVFDVVFNIRKRVYVFAGLGNRRFSTARFKLFSV